MGTKDKEIKVTWTLDAEILFCERDIEQLKITHSEDPNLPELIREQETRLQIMNEIKTGVRALPDNTIRAGVNVLSLDEAETVIDTLKAENECHRKDIQDSVTEKIIADNNEYIELIKKQLSKYSESDDLPEGVFRVGVCTYTVDEAENVIATLEKEKIELLEKWPFSEVEDCIADDDHNIMLLKEGIAKYSATHPLAPR